MTLFAFVDDGWP